VPEYGIDKKELAASTKHMQNDELMKKELEELIVKCKK
jgi:hypothetical protein